LANSSFHHVPSFSFRFCHDRERADDDQEYDEHAERERQNIVGTVRSRRDVKEEHQVHSDGGRLRWIAPVHPGDVLHLEGEVESLIPPKTKPQGTVVMKWTMYNQHGEAVYEFTPMTVVPRRP
jgi:hypothetical protein